MAKLILTVADAANPIPVPAGLQLDVFGTSEVETYDVAAGADANITTGGGVDIIRLAGASSDYTVRVEGTTAIFTHIATGKIVSVPMNTAGDQISFAGGTPVDLKIDTSTGTPVFQLGAQELTTTDAPVTGVVDEPTYVLTADVTEVDEGGTVTLTLETTNVDAGTEVAVAITGIDAADVVGGVLPTVFTVGADGTATLAIELAEDATVEGEEILTATVAGAAPVEVIVNDTSTLPVYDLEAFLALETPPEDYSLTDAVYAAGAVTVADAGAAYADVEAAIAGAANAAELDIATLFTWSIADTAANIFAAMDDATVTGATSVGITDTAVSVADAVSLLTIANFDGVYALADTLANLDAADDAVLEAATEYSLTNPAGDLGTISVAQKLIVDGAVNAADYTYGITGESVELTTGLDIVAGTADDDIITGAVSSLSSDNTLNPGDQIDGGEGDDTLVATMTGNFAGFSSTGFLKNVETVELTNDSTVARTFSAAGVSGVEEYVLNAAKAAISLSNLATTDSLVSINDQASGTTTIGYATDVTTGTTDEQNIALNNVGRLATDSTSESVVTLTAAGIETLNLDISGDNVVKLGSNDASAVTVSGGSTLKLTGVSTGLETFNASGTTGDLDIDLTGSTSTITQVIGGDGNDRFTIEATDTAANAEINGGAGANTLEFGGASATAKTVQYAMSGVQTVELANKGALTFSAANTSGLEAIVATKDIGAGATFAGLGSADIAVNLQGAGASATVSVDHSGATTLTVDTPTSTATNTSPTTNDVDVTATNSTALNLSVADKMNYTGTVTANKATSVELAITGKTTGANVVAGAAGSVIISAVANDSTLDLDAGEATDVQVTAAKGLELTSNSTLSKVESLTVDTAGTFKVGNLTSLADATLSGSGSVQLGDLGSITQDYALNLTATGLSTDKAGSSNMSLETGKLDTKGHNITVDASDVLGKVNLGEIDAVNDATTGGDVMVYVDGTAGNVALSSIAGNDVIIDAGGALGSVTYGGTIAVYGDTLTFTGANLTSNAATVDINGATLNAALTGGLENDCFTFTGFATGTAAQKLVLTGDLGLGSDAVTVNVTDHGASTGAITIDASGLEGVETLNLTVGATQFSAPLDYSGIDGSDVLDFSAMQQAFASAVTLDLNAGDGAADFVNFGSSVTFYTGASNKLLIEGFEEGTAGSDVIQFATGYLSGTSNAASVGTGTGMFTEVASLSNETAFTGLGSNKVIVEITGTADLSAASATDAGLVWAEIVGGTSGATYAASAIANQKLIFIVDDGSDSYLWAFNSSDSTASSGDIKLLGIVDGVNDFAAGDFAIV